MNQIYNMLNNNTQPNNLQNLIQQYQQFRAQFKGNPQQQVQHLLNSGKITQEQYNKAVETANQFRQILGM